MSQNAHSELIQAQKNLAELKGRKLRSKIRTGHDSDAFDDDIESAELAVSMAQRKLGGKNHRKPNSKREYADYYASVLE